MNSPTFFDKSKKQAIQDDYSNTKLNMPSIVLSMACQLLAPPKATILPNVSPGTQSQAALKI